MRQIGFGVLLAVMLVAGPVFALTGNELLDRCRHWDSGEPGEDVAGAGFCLGYTEAVSNVMFDHNVHGFQACLPGEATGITVGQLRDIIVRYLEEHPADRHHLASSVAAKALSDAFPCP